MATHRFDLPCKKHDNMATSSIVQDDRFIFFDKTLPSLTLCKETFAISWSQLFDRRKFLEKRFSSKSSHHFLFPFCL